MGSQADAAVAETCEKLGITLVEQSVSGLFDFRISLSGVLLMRG